MQPHVPTFHHNNTLLYCILSFQQFITSANTTCKLPEDGVLTPKHGEILIYRVIKKAGLKEPVPVVGGMA